LYWPTSRINSKPHLGSDCDIRCLPFLSDITSGGEAAEAGAPWSAHPALSSFQRAPLCRRVYHHAREGRGKGDCRDRGLSLELEWLTASPTEEQAARPLRVPLPLPRLRRTRRRPSPTKRLYDGYFWLTRNS
jgi:hypothetical protein